MASGRILVTGGSGFIGTNVVEFYSSKGWEVLSLDSKGPQNSKHQSMYRECDINDRDRLLRQFSEFKPELVVHLAARADLDGKTVEDYYTNISGNQNVVDAVNKAGSVRRAVYASSRMVFETGYMPKHEWDYKPAIVYGRSKVETEKIIRAQPKDSVPWLIFRPTSIWGEWFHVPYRDFFLTIANNRYVHPKGARIVKSYGYVGNAVYEIDRYLHATDEQFNGHAYFVSDYPPMEVLQWGTLIQKAIGSKPIKEVPFAVMKAAALFGDGLKAVGIKKFPLTSFRLNNLMQQLDYDLSREQSVCGNLPYSLEEGVERTVKWMRDVKMI